MTTATAATTSTTSSPTPSSPGTGRAGGGRPDLLVAHNLTELIGRTPLLQVPSLDPPTRPSTPRSRRSILCPAARTASLSP
jgi:hypothetical protein